MTQWKDIESASKNPEGSAVGPWIIAWYRYDHSVRQVRWAVPKEGLLTQMEWVDLAGKRIARQHDLTHWMPLPEPPQERNE